MRTPGHLAASTRCGPAAPSAPALRGRLPPRLPASLASSSQPHWPPALAPSGSQPSPGPAQRPAVHPHTSHTRGPHSPGDPVPAASAASASPSPPAPRGEPLPSTTGPGPRCHPPAPPPWCPSAGHPATWRHLPDSHAGISTWSSAKLTSLPNPVPVAPSTGAG